MALLPPGPAFILQDGDRALLADWTFEGVAMAEAYQRPSVMHCIVPVADLLSPSGVRIDQLLHGEAFDALKRDDGRLWGRARRDGVVGWVNEADLKPGAPLAQYQVASTKAVLPLNALVTEAHPNLKPGDLRPIGHFATDMVEVAQGLLGCPHILGGRSSRGTDCSGLVQQALLACGQAGPRRAEAQAQLGEPVAAQAIQRNDLAIWLKPDSEWTGHSALVVDAHTLIHATGHHGAVVAEPLAEVEARLVAEGYATAVFRRL